MKILRIVVVVVIVVIIIAILAVSCRNNGQDEANTDEPTTTQVVDGSTDNQDAVGETDAKQPGTDTTGTDTSDNSDNNDNNDPQDASDPKDDDPDTPTATLESGTITIAGEGTFVVLDTEDGSYTTVTSENGTATAVVPAGAYHVFAYGDDYDYTAVWNDGGGLSPITVDTDQTVEVTASAPADACSSMYQLPGTADGKYTSTASAEYTDHYQCETTASKDGSGTGDVAIPIGDGSGEIMGATGGKEQTGVALPPAGKPDLMGCTQPNEPQPTGAWYLVQPCDNLFRIGLAYGMSWQTIAYYNALYSANHIVPGQWLYIPWQSEGGTGGTSPKPVERGETSPPPVGKPDLMGCTQPNDPEPTGSWYIVQPCDNLYRIGLAYGLSWTTIAYHNGLYSADHIVPGQRLHIP